MIERIISPRLTDIIDAIEKIGEVLHGKSLDAFEADWQAKWLVERGVEIISEASRHLPDELKARHPEIPWRKVASIGNVLRHGYDSTAGEILWKLARDDLSPLEKLCREELKTALDNERDR